VKERAGNVDIVFEVKPPLEKIEDNPEVIPKMEPMLAKALPKKFASLSLRFAKREEIAPSAKRDRAI